MGKKGNNHLKSITCQVFLIFSTLLEGVLLIHHPRGLFKSPKVTKNATKIIRSCLAGLFIGNEGNNHLKSITCSVLLIFPTLSPPGVIYHPSITQGSFSVPQSGQKCHQDNKILLSRPFHKERGEQSPGIYHLLSLSDLSYPVPLLGWYIPHPLP